MSKQNRAWYFTKTSTPLTRGTRFRDGDKPPQATFQNLVDSALFFTESSDRAKVYSNATSMEDQVGHVVLSSDDLTKSNSAQMPDRSLVVQPHQMVTVQPASNAISTAVGNFNDFTTKVVVDPSILTRNNYLISFSDAFVTYFQNVINTIDGNLGDYIPMSGTAGVPVTGDILLDANVRLYNDTPQGPFQSLGNFSLVNSGHFSGTYNNVLRSNDFSNVDIYTEQSQDSNFMYRVATYNNGVIGGLATDTLNYQGWSITLGNYYAVSPSELRFNAMGLGVSTAGTYFGVLRSDTLTNDRLYQMPNQSGTLALVSDIPVIPGNIIYNTTSSSSHPNDCTTKTFVVPAGLAWGPGNPIRVFRVADPNVFMVGTVQSYVGTNLTILFNYSQGIGTFTDWNITLGNGVTYTSVTGNGDVTYNAETDLITYTPGVIQITRALVEITGTIHNDGVAPVGNTIMMKKNGLDLYPALQSVINGQQEFINFSVITSIFTGDTISVTGTAAGGDERMEDIRLTIIPLFI